MDMREKIRSELKAKEARGDDEDCDLPSCLKPKRTKKSKDDRSSRISRRESKV